MYNDECFSIGCGSQICCSIMQHMRSNSGLTNVNDTWRCDFGGVPTSQERLGWQACYADHERILACFRVPRPGLAKADPFGASLLWPNMREQKAGRHVQCLPRALLGFNMMTHSGNLQRQVYKTAGASKHLLKGWPSWSVVALWLTHCCGMPLAPCWQWPF